MDLYSITASHFKNAGSAGYIHFNVLLNAFISNINNTNIEELNSVYALFLHKGHNKEKTLDSSYRTISTCPLIAKGLDIYIPAYFGCQECFWQCCSSLSDPKYVPLWDGWKFSSLLCRIKSFFFNFLYIKHKKFKQF